MESLLIILALGSLLSIIYFFCPEFICTYLNKLFSSSPGNIRREIALKEIQDYKNLTLEYLGNAGDSLTVIGHMGGNYKRYPYDWQELEYEDKIEKKTATYRTYNAVELMKSAFDDSAVSLNGAEFDLQMGPENTIYITHNSLEGFEHADARTKSWFRENTLEKLIEELKMLYRTTGKGPQLYLEIKCKNDRTLSDNELAVINRALEIINLNLEDTLKDHISFVSFNLKALQTVGKLDSSYELFFILATNTNIGYLASNFSCTKYLSYLDEALKESLIEDSYITGIWFDPVHFQDFATHLNHINSQRRDGKLKMFISTYYLPKTQYMHRIQESREKLHNLSGIIVDLLPM